MKVVHARATTSVPPDFKSTLELSQACGRFPMKYYTYAWWRSAESNRFQLAAERITFTGNIEKPGIAFSALTPLRAASLHKTQPKPVRPGKLHQNKNDKHAFVGLAGRRGVEPRSYGVTKLTTNPSARPSLPPLPEGRL